MKSDEKGNDIMEENRVVFYSKRDLANGYELQKGEPILRAETKRVYTDINDVLELYNLKKFIDNKIYLRTWTQDDIANFEQKVKSYSQIITRFMVDALKNDFKTIYRTVSDCYESSFWEIINNYDFLKNISHDDFRDILNEESYLVKEFLQYEKLVKRYSDVIKDFFLSHPESAELLLSIYEIEEDNPEEKSFLPKCLTIEDKETIINNYLDSSKVNPNYLSIIQHSKKQNDFVLSDKTRLKASRLYQAENEKFFNKTNGLHFGVSVSFPENAQKIKDGRIKDGFIAEYSYSLDFIKANNNPHALFENFFSLFEYLDNHRRIRLVSKKSSLETIERFIGIHSKSEYIQGISFRLSEMTSQLQIDAYIQVLENMGISLESVLQNVYSVVFHEKYGYDENVYLNMPISTSFFEKVRALVPEFEFILKQYKLFVEDGSIDFELLKMSSSPTSVKDIPSLNQDKYIYLNYKDSELENIMNLFFSDQTLLGYVEPYKEKHYHTFFDVLSNEEVAFDKYKEHQKPKLEYLIDKNYIFVDVNGNIQFFNPIRVNILYDLYQNEVGAFYWYDKPFQEEAKIMQSENLVYFESTLFSKPEQDYFNFYLNKSEFTNGHDLRNKYVHGTQKKPEEIDAHKDAYHTILKLIVLALLKMEDDLIIHKLLS